MAVVVLRRRRERGAPAADWELANPVLDDREIGIDITNRTLKVGDGLLAWVDLPVALRLDGNISGERITSGTIPEERIPASITRDSELTAAVDAAVSALVGGAPDALNTLNELAAAFDDDANFAATVAASLAAKAPLASPSFTGTVVVSDDVESTTIGRGAIVQSPNGTRWRITVDDDGALVTAAL